MSKKSSVFLILTAAAIGFIGGSHAAGVPPLKPMIFSGLLEEAGVPITTDTTVRVRFYAASQGGSPLCETSDVVTPDSSGRFSLQLADTCTDAVAANPETYTEVQVGNETLQPRQQNGAVPYALEAKRASEASGQLAAAVASLQEATQPEKIFTAVFSSSGAVTRQHPQWISSGTLDATGAGSVTFSLSLNNPVCIATGLGGGITAGATNVTSTGTTIQTRVNQTSAPAGFSLLCHAAPL